MEIRLARDQEEVQRALELRARVFTGEQGIRAEADRDGRDGKALHVIASSNGALLGTCRLVVAGQVAMLGRLAVERAERGSGVGRAVLAEAERAAADAGATRVVLHAQIPVKGFYERSGYTPYGEEFVEEGIRHVAMEKRLA
jgi:predicted GNAT family N-acyltransferase